MARSARARLVPLVTTQQADLLLWLLARATGIASFLALLIAVISGIALRTSVFDRLLTNRELRSLHQFMGEKRAELAAAE